jgi:aminomethyltransferase
VVSWTKGEFRGRAPLAAEKERGIARRLRGLTVEGRQPPRQGYGVLVDGKLAGEVTSGNFSPILEQGIALAFLPPSVEPGAAVEVEIRGRPVPASVAPLPFLRKQKGS